MGLSLLEIHPHAGTFSELSRTLVTTINRSTHTLQIHPFNPVFSLGNKLANCTYIPSPETKKTKQKTKQNNTMCNTHVSIKVKNCLYSIYTCRASINCLVPDLAMVPRLLTRSALVIPIPVSMTVRVLSSLLGMIVIFISFSGSRTDGSVRLW